MIVLLNDLVQAISMNHPSRWTKVVICRARGWISFRTTRSISIVLFRNPRKIVGVRDRQACLRREIHVEESKCRTFRLGGWRTIAVTQIMGESTSVNEQVTHNTPYFAYTSAKKAPSNRAFRLWFS